MENFKHFIITRFNLQVYNRDKNRVPTRTDKWLSERFDIFEKFCLPSIKAQRCGNFVWLCLFDIHTPEKYLKRIEQYQRELPSFRPLFYGADQVADLTSSLRRDISGMITSGVEHVITTNLDNDDSLSIHAIEKLQAHIVFGDKKTVYVLSDGCQYFTQMDFALGLHLDNNHFMTLMEPYTPDLETIVSFRHARVAKYLDTVLIDTPQPMWLEVVHAANVSNDLRIYHKAKNKLILKGRSFGDFGLDLKVSCFGQVFKSFFVLPFKFLSTGYNRLRTKSERKKDSASVRCEVTDSL